MIQNWKLRRSLMACFAVAVMTVSLTFAQGNSEDAFVFATREEPATLDPHVETNNPPRQIFEAVYEALLDYDPTTLELVPNLATSWTVAPDGLSIDIELRDDVLFHDGSSMTPEAVKYSFERMQALNLGFAFLISAVDEVEITGDSSVRLRLSQVDPGLVQALPLVYIVSPTSFEANTVNNDWARGWVSENVAGTGPYRLVAWEKNQQFEFESFDEYWGGWDHAHIDRYIFRIVGETATQRQLIERGTAHLADTVEFEDLEALSNNPDVQILETQSLRQFYLILNTSSGPLADVRVRRAIAAVFDPKVIAEEILRGHARVPRGPLPELLPAFNSDIRPTEQDLELARSLLEEAGLVGSGQTLTYVYFAPYSWQRINGELLQAHLATMGINLQVEGLPFTTLTERSVNPETRPDIVAASVGIPTPDPNGLFYQMFHSSSNHWSRNGYVSDDITALLDQAAVEVNAQERMELFRQVQTLVMEELPIIPFTVLNDVKLARADVRGYQFHPMRPAVANWYDLYLE